MAKLGFYEIRTIECLNREYDVKKVGFRNIPDYEKEQQVAKPEPSNKREKKAFDKEMIVVQPMEEMRGHTAYLTSAIKF